MQSAYSLLKDGKGTISTAGTRVQLSSTSVPSGEVTITANANNAAEIVYGGSTVVAAVVGRSGTPLVQGNSVTLKIDDLSKVWLDAVTSGDGYSFSYLA